MLNYVEEIEQHPETTDPTEFETPGGARDLDAVQEQHIVNVLNQCQWVIGGESGAAAVLGMPPSTLRSRMKKLGIERPLY